MSAILYARKPTKARTVPSSEGDEICSIAEGEAVTVTGYCNETGWYRIEYEGQIGYVHHRHLTEEFSE